MFTRLVTNEQMNVTDGRTDEPAENIMHSTSLDWWRHKNLL